MDDSSLDSLAASTIRGEFEPSNDSTQAIADVVGNSDALRQVYDVVERVAATPCTVLITGKSGSGKEVVANSLHKLSERRGDLVAVNCGAIPENLLESEMFGHVKGAFTGATGAKDGYVALAEGGTLFLDEVAELPLNLQVKLLRLLQSREYSPVGDRRRRKVDVRIVAATNVDLEEAVREGRFREDLYYRLNVIHIKVPSLSERVTDIPALAEHFLRRATSTMGRSVQGISEEAMETLCAYDWPGNVRELENTIERAVLLGTTDMVEPDDLPPRVRGEGERTSGTFLSLPKDGLDLRETVGRYEDELIRQALERTEWNKNRAARLLGVNRTTLVEMIKRKRLAG